MPTKFRPSSIVNNKGEKTTVHYYIKNIPTKELVECVGGKGDPKRRAKARKELDRRGVVYENS